MKNIISTLFLALFSVLNAQQDTYSGNVGINTTSPTENLHVNGVAHANLLYLRSPGEPQELPIFFMASEVTQRNLNVFNPPPAKPSLVNLLELTFNDISNQGVTDYDTKIDATQYIVAVRSFSLSNATIYDNADLNVYSVHNSSPSNNTSQTYYQGSPDFVAFISGGTWHVRGFYRDSRFTDSDGDVENSDRFSMKLQLLVYKKIITKNVTQVQQIDIGGTNGSSASYILPKPGGF